MRKPNILERVRMLEQRVRYIMESVVTLSLFLRVALEKGIVTSEEMSRVAEKVEAGKQSGRPV